MLELLATKHDDWVRIAFSMTGDMDDAQDLVQDMYLRLERLGKTKRQVSYKDTVNRYFIWTVLFNMVKEKNRSVNKQAVSYWKDVKKKNPEKFYSMAEKERRDTEIKGFPCTFLKDTRPPYTGASLFLLPNENYPDVRDISMVRVRREKKSIKTYPLVEDLDLSYRAHDEYDFEEEEAFKSIMIKVNKIVKSLPARYTKLFDLYYMQGMSLRGISAVTNVGVSWIHRSILELRDELRKELSEDLMDYFNQDYDKI